MSELSKKQIHELKKRAKAGDKVALQTLRESGFFKKQQAKKGYPLSPGQRRLWVLQQMAGRSSAYNIPYAVRFKGALDTAVFTQALNSLTERHESLQAYFALEDNAPRQFTQAGARFPLTVLDLRTAEDPEQAAVDLVRQYANQTFDLEQFPLYAGHLLQIGREEFIFFFNIHHIIGDAWSTEVLVGELATLYEAYAQNRSNPLPPLTKRYYDYARALNQHLKSDAGQQDRAYWLKQLGDVDTLLNIPSDQPRPPVMTFDGDVISTAFARPATDALQGLARKQGSTLFMAMVAWVNLLLYRYTGQEDIIVGTPIAGRDQAEWQNQVGFFVNTLALRNKIDGAGGFQQLLGSVRQTALDAYQHQQYPFDQLVEDLDLTRDMSRNPLFDVMVHLQHLSADSAQLGTISLEDFDTGFTPAKFDLTFEFVELAGELTLHLNYNRHLYGRDRIERLVSHLHILLDSLVSQPDLALKRLPILPEAELAQLMSWNETTTRYPREQSMVARFEEIVAQYPEKEAVAVDGKSLTYQQLNEMANRVAYTLRHDYEIRPEEPVGILLDRSEWTPIALLAILKAGGAYLSIDPAYPASRIDYIMSDTACRIILSEPQYMDRQALAVDITQLVSDYPENLGDTRTGRSLACLIYTSGSTGKPKASLIEHRSIMRLVINTNYMVFDESSRILQTGSLAFDASIYEIWGALLSGGTLCLPGGKALLDARKLSELIGQHRATTLLLTTSLFNQVVEADVMALKGLETLLSGGEKVSVTHFKRVREALPDVNLLHMYGPSENTTYSTYYPVKEIGHDIPIGYPISNSTIYILDQDGEPMPIGIPGEICVGGDGVARGYLNRPELTAERFVESKNEWIQQQNPDSKIYKTGDMGVWLADGSVQFVGRIDNQLKIRGFRVEPGEIEQYLHSFGPIQQAIVLPRTTSVGTKELLGYVVGDRPLTAQEIKQYLRDKLPEYMIPAHFVQLPELPLNQSGKIDRKALPAPELYGLNDGRAYTAPRDEQEAVLAAVFQEVLGLPQIGIHDNYFEIGGDSIRAIQITNRLLQQGWKLDIQDLFTAPTIAELVATRQTAMMRIEPIPTAEHYPVSHAQRRLWVIENMGVGRAAYNISTAMWLDQGTDIAVLEQTLQQLVARHEAMRTRFAEFDGELRQIIQDQVDWSIDQVAADIDSADQLQQKVEEEAGRPFDLSASPLFRFTLFTTESRPLLLFSIHHIISDGWSLDVLLDELGQLLAGKTLAPLTIQYKDYAAWQEKFLADEGDKLRDFWLDTLSGELPLLDLPADKPRPSVRTFAGTTYHLTWDQEESQALLRLGQAINATPFMVVLALVNGLFYRYTGQDDIILGYPTAGRDHPDLMSQVGFYVNMLPLRQRIAGEKSLMTLLGDVQQTVAAAFDHQQYPFDRLVDELNLRRDMGRSPIYDVAVSLLSLSENKGQSEVLPLEDYQIDAGISKWDMHFAFNILPDGRLHLSLEYTTDLFGAARIDRLGTHLKELARSMVQSPHLPLQELNILPAAEWEQISTFNDTGRDYPTEQTIAARFEEQVTQWPDRPAVMFQQTTLTYRELNERANRLAHALLEQYGVRPEEPVAVLLDRSEWTAVALLGILKAGGAYVPIDPAYPASRIDYIVQDTGCSLILSEPKYLDRQALTVDIADLQSSKVGNPAAVGNGESLAYIIYTSGSTGQPKGSLIGQRSVLRLVINTDFLSFDENIRILQTGSLAFDASTLEIWGALLNGGALCLPGGKSLLDASKLAELIRHYQATTIWLTASLFNQIVEADVMTFTGLTTVLTGGEKLSVTHCQKFREALPDVALRNGYGPTENTTFSTTYPIVDFDEGDIPIGYPIANSTVHIVDPLGQPVPIGIPGELYVGGDGLARGYLNRPDLTAERFIEVDTDQLYPAVPEGSEPTAKVYKTGDLGSWLPDGSVKFIGRIDGQLKIRGFRVEPGEIEQSLLGFAPIKEAAVIPRTTSVGTKELIGYVVSPQSLTSQEIKRHLSDKLPSYMIPSHFVQLAELPLNQNGKIDRRALPEPELYGLNDDRDYTAPRDEQETVLAAVLQDVLGLPQIGIHDNYFEIGGDSIRAIQITSRLLQRGWKLEIQDLFALPTIAELGPMLQAAVDSNHNTERVIGAARLTPVQRWFFTHHAGHEAEWHHFNQAILLRSVAPIDQEALTDCLAAIVDHHDLLRATYPAGQQEIAAEMAVMLDVIACQSESEFTEAIDAAHQQFDLAAGPLFRAALLRTAVDGDRLLLVAHHLVVDGVSWRILFEDLERAYQQSIAGQPIELGGKTTSFQAWGDEVDRYANGVTFREAAAYWEDQLSTAASLSQPEPVSNTYAETDTISFALSETETSALLTETHHAYHTEINDLLLVALARALETWQGGQEALITLEGHGRDGLADTDTDIDVSRTVGWFTTMYPHLLAIPEFEIGEQIKGVKERLRETTRYSFAYGALRYGTETKIEADIRPLLSFNYLGQFDSTAEENGFFSFAAENSGTVMSAGLPREHALDVVGLVASGQMSLSITFNPQQYSQAEIEAFWQAYQDALLDVTEHCQQQQDGEMTASDYTADLSADDLSAILGNWDD